MNYDKSNQVTVNQAKGLRRFDIREAKIQTMNKKQVSELQLIERARSKTE